MTTRRRPHPPFTPPVPNADTFTDFRAWERVARAKNLLLAGASGSMVAQTQGPRGVCKGAWFYESQRGWMVRD